MTLLAGAAFFYIIMVVVGPQPDMEGNVRSAGLLYKVDQSHHLGTARKLVDKSSWGVSNTSGGGGADNQLADKLVQGQRASVVVLC